MWTKSKLIYLVIGIPVSSVLFGMVMIYFATRVDDAMVKGNEPPLSKVSWQVERPQETP